MFTSRTRIWFPLLSFFEAEVDGIVPNEFEGPVTILSNLRGWAQRAAADARASALGAKLSEGEYSVVRLVDGIKRNLSLVEEFSDARQRLTLDKNIQACLLDDERDLRRRSIAELREDALRKEFPGPPSPAAKKTI